MLAKDYAVAVYETVEAGESVKDALRKLDSLLASRGHTKLQHSIYVQLLKYADAKSASDLPTVTVAEKSDATKLQKEIKKVFAELSASEDPILREDKNIIGGFIATHNGKSVDASYKTKLLSLYRHITK